MKFTFSIFLLVSIGYYSDATNIKDIGPHDSLTLDDSKLGAINTFVKSNQAKVVDSQGEYLRGNVRQDSILENDADDAVSLEDGEEWYEKDFFDRDALVSLS